MAKLSLLAGTTSKLIDVFIQDTSVTTGAGLTGLTNGSGSLTWYYYREGAATSVQVTAIASMTLGTWVTKGFIVVDGTNMPGVYQLGVPDAALAAGAKSVVMMLKGATNMAPVVIEIELTAVDNQDGVHFGLTALPNTAVTTNGSLITSGTGTAQLSVSSGQVDLGKILTTAVSTPATAGILDVNLKNIANAAVSASTAQLGVNVVNNAGSAITSTAGVQEVKVASIAANAITAASINADAITDAKVAADVTIASVTGNVGGISGITFPTRFSSLAIDVSGNVTFGNTSIGTATNLTNLPSIPANWLTAAGIASGALDAVWSTAARTLTAGTNIQLPSNGLANVTAWTVAITGNITGNLSGSVGSVTGLTASDVGTIKTQTDKLTFSIANQLDANIQSVNDVTVNGVGTSGSPWGP